MTFPYEIKVTSEIYSPALVLFPTIVEENLDKMIAIAGNADRLRPHCKTHKMSEVVKMELERGIDKHKCATFAEAEMLYQAGVRDIFLAYNIVGPNIGRVVKFCQQFPDAKLSISVDHPKPLAELSDAVSAAGLTVDALIDIDTGQHRTGLPAGQQAIDLYGQIVAAPGLNAGGLHVYDGHQHQVSKVDRTAAVMKEWEAVIPFRDQLLEQGYPVPRIVAGGTGSFPVYAEIDDPTIELSPGTCVFGDSGYGTNFPDLQFTPAAVLLTRVISRPTDNRITCDLGYKAVASDPAMANRVVFPQIEDAKLVLQNEEHLVIETDQANSYQPGDELIAIPHHVCPTSALHKQVFVIVDGQLSERWDVIARDRWLTV